LNLGYYFWSREAISHLNSLLAQRNGIVIPVTCSETPTQRIGLSGSHANNERASHHASVPCLPPLWSSLRQRTREAWVV